MSNSVITESTAVELLVAAGFDVSVRPDQRGGVGLVVSRDGESAAVDVALRQKTIYEWDALRLLENTNERVLVVVPTASRSLIEVARRDRRLGVVSIENRLIVWNREESQSPDAPPTSGVSPAVPGRRRKPWGRWAVMRAYLLDGEPRSQVELARVTGVTQSAVSKSNSALAGLVVKSSAGWRATDRSALWDAFMSEYEGPGGITTHWYGLDAITNQSDAVVSAGESAGIRAISSGDSAADRLAPWRVPARAIVYATSGLALDKLGFAQTTDERATLSFTVPADHTVWATAALWLRQHAAPTVDPVLAAWDVARTGGPDADEAVTLIRDLVITGGRS